MPDEESVLWFNKDTGPVKGWDSTAIGRSKVSDERVYRELVQNSLDASEGSQSLEITFYLHSISQKHIPHIKEYKEAFERAVKTERVMQNTGPSGKQVPRRIEEVLSHPKIECLFCVDNGRGIDGDVIQRLYSEGITDSQVRRRGSAGKGHLTAFAPSELRYVLYAGRNRDHGDVFGGHAILATQDTRDLRTSTGDQFSPDGFIRYTHEIDGHVSDLRGAKKVPSTLGSYIPSTGTGSVVMVCGYQQLNTTPKHLKPCSHEQHMLSAVTKNFLVAIYKGDLLASFRFSDQVIQCNSHNISEVLDPLSRQISGQHGISGPSGELASKLLKVLEEGQHRTLSNRLDRIEYWVRPLSDHEDGETTVALFREGMWITDKCRSLQAGDFSDRERFHAVVNLLPTPNREETLTSLVRETEDDSHLSMLVSQLDKHQKAKLYDLLEELRMKISGEIGAREEERYIPSKAYFIFGSAEGTVTAVESPSQKPFVLPDDEIETEGYDYEEEYIEHLPDGPPNPIPSPSEPRLEQVRARKRHVGKPIAGMRKVASLVDERQVEIAWVALDGFPTGAMGIRIVVPDGSDETSEREPTFLDLPLSHANIGNQTFQPASTNCFEVRVNNPNREGNARVFLSRDFTSLGFTDLDAQLVNVEIVHRSPDNAN